MISNDLDKSFHLGRDPLVFGIYAYTAQYRLFHSFNTPEFNIGSNPDLILFNAF